MKTGKLSENVFKRSVLRQIKTKRDEVVNGAGIGENCAIFSFGKESFTASATASVVCKSREIAGYVVHEAVNHLAAAGAEAVAVTVSLLMPLEAEEADVKAVTAQVEEACAKLQVQAAGFQVSATDAVKSAVVTVTAVGSRRKETGILKDMSSAEAALEAVSSERAMPSVKAIKAGQDIVASKWIGLEGTAAIARSRGEELLTKYPVRFLEEAKEFDRFLSIVPEAATAIKSGVCAMYDVSEGGIFAALWEMAEGADVGLEIDLKKIPVRQETIEVCEFFEINPYELKSDGCLLMAVDNGYDLVRALEAQHIPAAVIGKTMDNNDRVVINEDERRFLERAKPDELYKVLI